MSGATNINKSCDKSKYVYRGYTIAIHGLGLWRFGKNFARNVTISGIDNSYSLHTDNCKNIFLVLGERSTDDINGSIGAAEKNFSINLNEVKAKFCLSLQWNSDNSYLFVNGKEICKFKADNNHVNFPSKLSLESISNKTGYVDKEEASCKGHALTFRLITILLINLAY